MANKNTLLGGTDWADTQILYAADLNDTINVVANHALTLTGFWLKTGLRTLWDDFSGYTAGAAVPATLWTTSGSGTYSFITRATTNAGGSSKEGELYATTIGPGASYCTAETVTMTANKHKFVKVYYSLSATCSGGLEAGDSYFYVSFDGGSTEYVIASLTGSAQGSRTATGLSILLIVAKGSNEYDCYVGGKLVQTVTDATFTLKFRAYASGGSGNDNISATCDITDIYEGIRAV